MNHSIQYELGELPRCALYKRERTPGKVSWYISYFLPGKKRVQRPCHKDYRQAQRLLKIKEQQLLQGQFDEKDQEILGQETPELERPRRLTIQEAVSAYLAVTGPSKRPSTRYIDEKTIPSYFRFFQTAGQQWIDQIRPMDVQLFINQLDRENKSEATLRAAMKTVRKVYNWLIEVEAYAGNNPAGRTLKIPKKGGMVRDRMASTQEIQSLLSLRPSDADPIAGNTPIVELAQFLVLTGCRLGEALNAEFSDFEKGVWFIRCKPDCPTKDGLGWMPKWGKSRKVFLLPAAWELVQSLPRRQACGYIANRDVQRAITGHSRVAADFIFSKRLATCLATGKPETVFCRIDNVKKAWTSLKEQTGVSPDLQMKDLRTTCNYMLKARMGFTTKEAAAYLGNSEEINELHYTPVSEPDVWEKLKRFDALGYV